MRRLLRRQHRERWLVRLLYWQLPSRWNVLKRLPRTRRLGLCTFRQKARQ